MNGEYEYKLLYSGQLSPVARLNANDEIVEQYVYGTRVNVPDYMVKNGRKYRILTDHKGSVRMVVDTHNWEIVQQTEYSPFGMIIDEQLAEGWEPVIFGYAGGLQDRDTGLVRFGARDYDPEVGRWTSKEPLGFNGASNFYVYAGNDPVNYVDITGLKPGKCYTLIDAVKNAGVDIANLYYNQSNDMQEYGTMLMQQGGCFFYTPLIKGWTSKDGTLSKVSLRRIYNEAKKLYPDATPLASIHNHPQGNVGTIPLDDAETEKMGLFNIIFLRVKGKGLNDGYGLNVTRGLRENNAPYPRAVQKAYGELNDEKLFIPRSKK